MSAQGRASLLVVLALCASLIVLIVPPRGSDDASNIVERHAYTPMKLSEQLVTKAHATKTTNSSNASAGAPAAAMYKLKNDVIEAAFSGGRLRTLERWAGSWGSAQYPRRYVSSVSVADDDFLIELNGAPTTAATKVLSSAKFSGMPSMQPGGNGTSLTLLWKFEELSVEVRYSLVSKTAAFVEKQLRLHPNVINYTRPYVHNVTNVMLFDNTVLTTRPDGLAGEYSGTEVRGNKPTASLTASSHYGLGAYAIFYRFSADNGGPADKPGPESEGVFVTAQNPYLQATTAASGATSLSYAPMMSFAHDAATAFEFDAGLIGLTTLTGEKLLPPAQALDVGEQKAMVDCLREYIVAPPAPNRTVKINIGWTENYFQLDIADAGNRTIYKRIIDRAADFGITHMLFAPRNSDVSSAQNNTDAWNWEQILWFGMGQRLRLGLWKPGDTLPKSLTEMLTYFKSKRVKPVAYVYPILAFLAGTYPGGSNPPWIINGSYAQGPDVVCAPTAEVGPIAGMPAPVVPAWCRPTLGYGPLRSSLASPSLQKWLPDTMVAFAEQTGAGGFGFDYTYFELNTNGRLPLGPSAAASQYAQWAGWRKILSRLHTLKGGKACGGSRCVVDNRQQNHAWGPWMWAQGGTYAEPLMSDEQPGSWMFYEADLHTDRLSANQQRVVAWNYRNLEFCPVEVLPGFALHQTDRHPTKLEHDPRSNNHARARDFDLLGYRYSILSSVGTAGLNNVINMLPARDEQEYSLLPPEDIAFVKHWMDWTDKHVSWLRNTKTITVAPTSAIVDAIAMIEANAGALFAFNPTAGMQTLSFTIDHTLGFGKDCVGLLTLRATGSSNRNFTPYDLDVVGCGENLNVSVPATTALVFEFEPASATGSVMSPTVHDEPVLRDQNEVGRQLMVFGGAATAVMDWASGMLKLSNTEGPAGESAELVITFPADRGPRSHVKSIAVEGGSPVSVLASPHCNYDVVDKNGHKVTVHANLTVDMPLIEDKERVDARCVDSIDFHGRPAMRVRGRWAGTRFENEIGTMAGFRGGAWSGEFNVLPAAMAQLAARNKSYPLKYDLNVDGNNDANVPWLAPGRLLIFVKYRPLLNDSFNATGSIDGKPLIMRKGYNTIVRSANRFIGYWADATEHVKPGVNQKLTLMLPRSDGDYSSSNGFLNAGNDIGSANVTIEEAKKHCSSVGTCAGFTFEKTAPEDGTSCTAIAGLQTIRYKSSMSGNNNGDTWCKMIKPAAPVGVFWENVQPLVGSFVHQQVDEPQTVEKPHGLSSTMHGAVNDAIDTVHKSWSEQIAKITSKYKTQIDNVGTKPQGPKFTISRIYRG